MIVSSGGQQVSVTLSPAIADAQMQVGRTTGDSGRCRTSRSTPARRAAGRRIFDARGDYGVRLPKRRAADAGAQGPRLPRDLRLAPDPCLPVEVPDMEPYTGLRDAETIGDFPLLRPLSISSAPPALSTKRPARRPVSPADGAAWIRRPRGPPGRGRCRAVVATPVHSRPIAHQRPDVAHIAHDARNSIKRARARSASPARWR